jgi:hypothetical protein
MVPKIRRHPSYEVTLGPAIHDKYAASPIPDGAVRGKISADACFDHSPHGRQRCDRNSSFLPAIAGWEGIAERDCDDLVGPAEDDETAKIVSSGTW